MPSEGLDFEQVIAELARGNVVAEGNLNEVLRFLTKRAAQALEVRRVSAWLYSKNRQKLLCLTTFDSADGTFCEGEELLASDHPIYFAALERMPTIAAKNAAQNPQTFELTEPYLIKHNIKTTLDAPMSLQGEVIGVVCHEHDEPREWTDAEKGFAAAVANFIALALEASRRTATEMQLSETEQLLSAVTEQTADGFCLLEPNLAKKEFVVRYVNPSGAAIFGYTVEELTKKPIGLFTLPDNQIDLFEIMRRAQTGKTIMFETLGRRKDGSVFTIEINFNLVQHKGRQMVALIGRDISERQAAETRRMASQAQELQTQRLESLGLLAGKIAHDFNNLLTGILGSATLAAHHLSDTAKCAKYVNNIELTALTAAELCNQLLIYSGKQEMRLSKIDLSNIVAEMIPLLSVPLPHNVRLISQTAAALPRVDAEPTQIRQIILNLITNAAEAVAPDSGEIKITTGLHHFTDEELSETKFDLQTAGFTEKSHCGIGVFLEVADNGGGIDPIVREQIFEPFFTTKKNGRGLGMASLAGIVRAHNGAIKIISAPNQGTAVRVWFPVKTAPEV